MFIRNRFIEEVRVAGDLFPRQFEFRAGRSTMKAVMEVVDAIYRVEAHCRPTGLSLYHLMLEMSFTS